MRKKEKIFSMQALKPLLTIWLVLLSSKVAQIVAGIPVLLAAIIKLYPAAAVIGLLSYYWKHPQKRWIWITALALFGVWIAFNYLEVIEISHAAPKPSGWVTFGGELFPFVIPFWDSSFRVREAVDLLKCRKSHKDPAERRCCWLCRYSN